MDKWKYDGIVKAYKVYDGELENVILTKEKLSHLTEVSMDEAWQIRNVYARKKGRPIVNHRHYMEIYKELMVELANVVDEEVLFSSKPVTVDGVTYSKSFINQKGEIRYEI